jgi:hypothetical protein
MANICIDAEKRRVCLFLHFFESFEWPFKTALSSLWGFGTCDFIHMMLLLVKI